jgi:hypothetical protein
LCYDLLVYNTDESGKPQKLQLDRYFYGGLVGITLIGPCYDHLMSGAPLMLLSILIVIAMV